MENMEEMIDRFLEVADGDGRGSAYETFSGSARDNDSGYGSGEFGCCAHGTDRGTGEGNRFESSGAVDFCGAGNYDGKGDGQAAYCDDNGYNYPIVPLPGTKSFCGKTVRYVDVGGYHKYPLIFESFSDGVARVRIVKADLTLSPPCWLARIGDSFALGKDCGLALDLATRRHQAAVSPEPEPEYTGDDELPF